MRHYLTNLLTNIYTKKEIVYWVQTFGIWSVFILIQFKLDQIVHDRPNITVTYTRVFVSVKPFHYMFVSEWCPL
jgi:hypothetical protein